MHDQKPKSHRGDRIPSVRQVCKELQVSQATAHLAYRILEAKGLILSRPRSGFFVNTTAKNNLIQKPSNGKYIPLPIDVTLNTMIANMLTNMKQFGLVNFFIFAPINELLPISRISKALRETLKDTDGDIFQYPLIEGIQD